MDSFSIATEIPIDLKVKSAIEHNCNWYLINIEHMMMMIAVENTSATNLPHDKFYPGSIHPIRVKRDGLHYYDQNLCAWIRMEDNVQRHFSDRMADEELLGEK